MSRKILLEYHIFTTLKGFGISIWPMGQRNFLLHGPWESEI